MGRRNYFLNIIGHIKFIAEILKIEFSSSRSEGLSDISIAVNYLTVKISN